MDIKLHQQAATTPKSRAENSTPTRITNSELVRQCDVATATIQRWRYRDNAHDQSHTRHNLLATLTSEQEEVLVASRQFFRLDLDNLLVVARDFLNPRLSRSGLHRMLKRRRHSQSAQDTRAFMKQVDAKAPFKIHTVLTDNDKSFADRFMREPTFSNIFKLSQWWGPPNSGIQIYFYHKSGPML